ncbi:Protein archease [Collichthys lucidus]|uniref:Protein archease n=1 Tax=Collichthys lucidus TaxID=240159 RepID=A0A4U5VEV9_COLLU|nr:Protein archease [Collichthys lucidus]
MFGYMTDTETVEPLDTVDVESEGDQSFAHRQNALQDPLYRGTEVKAITYSAMQIHDKEKPEIYTIVDI